MKQTIKLMTLIISALTALCTYAKVPDYLKECTKIHCNLADDNYLKITYQETKNRLYHSFKPWDQTSNKITGTVWCNSSNFLKLDSLESGKNMYSSQTHISNDKLLYVNYGKTELSAVSKDMHNAITFKTARYTPSYILNYFVKENITLSPLSNKDYAIYEYKTENRIVKLFIKTSDNTLNKVTILEFDDLYGDILTSYSYKNYKIINETKCPSLVEVSKYNGHVSETVSIENAEITSEVEFIIEKPELFSFQEEVESPSPEINTVQYNKNLYFIELKHTDDRVLLVEFKDFLLIAEAPLNSENGELIIAEAKKVAPNKPIKYFVFGHFHNHYTGGLRAFVHEEATILHSESNQEFVKYLVNTSHSLNSDKLELEPKELKLELVGQKKVITDGEFTMEIHFIGEKSAHTIDYLIYYFPSDKLLFQDDLVWIKKDQEIAKAGARQVGLYNAVKELELDIDTIIQSWPLNNYGVKTVIPYVELEQSIGIEE